MSSARLLYCCPREMRFSLKENTPNLISKPPKMHLPILLSTLLPLALAVPPTPLPLPTPIPPNISPIPHPIPHPINFIDDINDIPPTPDVAFPDDQACLHSYDAATARPPPACFFTDSLAAAAVLDTFKTCTTWDPLTTIHNLVNHRDDTEALIATCTNTPTSGVTGGCLTALHNAGNDAENPLHDYYHDIAQDPAKYCKCVATLTAGMPRCTMGEYESGTVQLVTCLLGEVCGRVEESCLEGAEEVLELCGDGSGVATYPPTCLPFLSPSLALEVDICTGHPTGHLPPATPADLTGELVTVLTVTVDAVVTIDVPSPDSPDPAQTVLRELISRELGEVLGADVAVTRIGDVLYHDRRLTVKEVGVTVGKETVCEDASDASDESACGSVDADAASETLLSSISGIEGASLTNLNVVGVSVVGTPIVTESSYVRATQIDPQHDFEHCQDFTDEPSTACQGMEAVRAGMALASLSTCTNWDLVEFGSALVDGAGTFEEVFAVCQPEEGRAGAECTAAITAIATDGDNPLSPYIHDLIENPTKFCGCVGDFGDGLPSCTVSPILSPTGSAVDLGVFKKVSCYFTELCDELESTCDVLITAESLCLSQSGATSGFSGDDASVVDCSLECATTVEVPLPCWKSAEVTPAFKEMFDNYEAACPHDGGGHLTPDVDFDDFGSCLAIYDDADEELDSCNLDMALGSAIVRFMSCTEWELGDLVSDFTSLDSLTGFEAVIQECNDATQAGMWGCFKALSDASEGDGPFSSYIGDVYNDPDKYCKCNGNMYKSLPAPCLFQMPGDGNTEFDLGQVKLGSCLIGELCDELEQACLTIGEELGGCLPERVKDITGSKCDDIVNTCSGGELDMDSLKGVGFPPGCYDELKSGVRKRVKKFQSVCVDGEEEEGGGKDGGSKDGEGHSNDSAADMTASTFPPVATYAIVVLMFAGLGYVVVRKVMKKSKHPQMVISFDDQADMDMDGTGFHAGGITMNQLRGGKAGGWGKLGDDGDDDADAGDDVAGIIGGGFADFGNSGLEGGGGGGGIRKPSNAVPVAQASAPRFEIGGDDDEFDKSGLGGGKQVAKTEDVEVSL